MLGWRAVSVALLASASMACAGVQARTLPLGPALEVPPPPRPADPPAAEPDPPVAQPSDTPATMQPVGRTPRTTPSKPATTRKADPPEKTEPPPVAAPAAAAGAGGAPAPSLQTTANVGGLEQKIRALLTRAARDLEKIDVRTLGTAARAQYDEAKRFAEQAEAALKVKNLAFAEQLADKAATLAGLLGKR